ncbi:MAG: tetratricopeptide repeat protein [Alphaproteobacteria bacterium]|nr:tetratricopeptide repeat protein [Alphaproteobacteria bacterium]MDA8005461.1 tetratricopeptide repeat protein [Alphaproteobacteria bacterium]
MPENNNEGKKNRAHKTLPMGKMYRLSPGDFADHVGELQSKAFDAYEGGKFDEAIELSKKIIDLYAQAIDAYIVCGLAYREKGAYGEAIEILNKATKVNPEDFRIHRILGEIYIKNGEYDEAVEIYEKLIEIEPDYTFAYLGRGNAYRAMGEHDKAINDYSEAIELMPDSASAYFNRGNVYSSRDEHDRAIEDYNKAIEVKPDHANAYFNRGALLAKEGNLKRAKEDFRKVCEIKPGEKSWKAYDTVTRLLMAQETKAGSKEELERVTGQLHKYAWRWLLIGPLVFIAVSFAIVLAVASFTEIANWTALLLPLAAIFILSSAPMNIYLVSLATSKKQLQQFDLTGKANILPQEEDAPTNRSVLNSIFPDLTG